MLVPCVLKIDLWNSYIYCFRAVYNQSRSYRGHKLSLVKVCEYVSSIVLNELSWSYSHSNQLTCVLQFQSVVYNMRSHGPFGLIAKRPSSPSCMKSLHNTIIKYYWHTRDWSMYLVTMSHACTVLNWIQKTLYMIR